MNIILIGKAGAGKDTVADMLVKKRKYKKWSFATLLKSIAYDLFPDKWETDKRAMLQMVGEKMRDIDVDCWAKYLLRSIGDTDNNVITDCRYPNEFILSVHEHSFLPVYISCADDIREKRLILRDGKPMSDAEKMHVSEQLKTKHLYMIDNNGTMEELAESVENMYKTLSHLVTVSDGNIYLEDMQEA